MSVTADELDTVRTGGVRRILDYGDRALLLEFDTSAEVLAWTEAVRAADLLGVVDIVPESDETADNASAAPGEAAESNEDN